MKKRNPNVRKPIDAFSKCPSCLHSHFLVASGIHVVCTFCDWDSIEAYTDAGGYDEVPSSHVHLRLA